MKKILSLLAISIIAASTSVSADNSITINNNNSQPPANNSQNNQSACNDNQDSDPGTPAGTYYQSNPHGGTDTVYTTGTKKPYIVDNPCNNQQPAYIAPQIFPQITPQPPVRR
jgi:hypothetical protein